MKWIVSEIMGPLARRVGGQASAALVAVGMATDHRAAVASAIAWAIISAAEVVVSSRSRKQLADRAKRAWGQN